LTRPYSYRDDSAPLRDKILWWLLYDSAARASEILALDVDHLDLPRRRAVVIGKDARVELIGWEAKTARLLLLPRLLPRRRNGPVFLAAIAPAPARQPALDPDTGRTRLPYQRAAEVFKDASGGRTLHQLRHSRLTHLAEAGLQLPMLMAKAATPASPARRSTPNQPSTQSLRPPPPSTPPAGANQWPPRIAAFHGMSRSRAAGRRITAW
jgi:integrase